MNLVAIIILWDDWDWAYVQAEHLLKNKMVDDIFIVYSEYSNYGEFSAFKYKNLDVEFINWEPDLKQSARDNETNKRNFGLKKAREYGFTHFIVTDADEMYEHEPFLKTKELFHVKPELQGLVCNCQTYFANPKLTIGLDITLVPFIHKLTDHIKHGFNKNYPFAWDGAQIRIDPTRSLNIQSGVERTDLIMHHYSWVRKDYQKKIRNSTARANLERSCILKDLQQSKEGYFCEYYQKTLVRASVDFEIPEYEFDQSSNTAIRQDL